MKKSIAISLLLITAFAISSCSSSQPASNASYDDVYFSSTPKQQAPAVNTSQNQTQSKPADYSSAQSNEKPSRFDYTENQPASPTTKTDQDGNTYITNNYYYDPDDYYDYAYTARLRRFYRPFQGWGYYDSYYTNSYWYDYNPASWGVSIYMGYNWWAPSYYYGSPFSWGFSISYGWPSYHCWGQPYWYWNYPYYYHSPYHAYWSGYNQGYWNGYWNGYYSGLYNNPYYYNSYDYNSYNNYYYGPRRTRTGGGSSVPRASLASLYQKSVDNDRPRTPVISTVSSEPRPMAPASVTPVKPGKNNASENAPAIIDNAVKPGKNPVVSEPRPAVNPAVESAPVKPGKDNTTRPDDYTPAPAIKNPPAHSDPRPNYNQQMDNNDNPPQPSVKPGRDDNYNNPPPRPKQEYQWESNPHPNQQYQYENNPRPQKPLEYESAPKPKIEYQPEPRPSYQQPKYDRPKMESRPQQSNPRPGYTPSEPRSNPAPASQPQQRDNSSKENKRR